MAMLKCGQAVSCTCSPVTSTSGALPAAGSALIVRSSAGVPPTGMASKFHTCQVHAFGPMSAYEASLRRSAFQGFFADRHDDLLWVGGLTDDSGITLSLVEAVDASSFPSVTNSLCCCRKMK